ncbi:MAG: hypothetical protein HQ593_00055 [Candidatus Omnitrophica bacterium]|nr:hypothetical protein [Candidatus Omnitrophota bacterium]
MKRKDSASKEISLRAGERGKAMRRRRGFDYEKAQELSKRRIMDRSLEGLMIEPAGTGYQVKTFYRYVRCAKCKI